MIFTIKVPFTRETGAEIPIRIRDRDGTLILTGPALIATGAANCLMDGEVATRIGLRFGEPYIVSVTSGDRETAECKIVFDQLPPGTYRNNVVLGMTFLSFFSVHFDGPYRVATLSSEAT